MLWRAEGELLVPGSDPPPPRFKPSPLPHLSVLLRLACRDIGGSDPERMAAPHVVDYVQELFTNSPVQVNGNIIGREQDL